MQAQAGGSTSTHWAANMNPNDPAFLAWARRFGYVPWQPVAGYPREKFYRYWIAWQAGIAPDCKQAHLLLSLSGLLNA